MYMYIHVINMDALMFHQLRLPLLLFMVNVYVFESVCACGHIGTHTMQEARTYTLHRRHVHCIHTI